jgi:hypothetical protein
MKTPPCQLICQGRLHFDGFDRINGHLREKVVLFTVVVSTKD